MWGRSRKFGLQFYVMGSHFPSSSSQLERVTCKKINTNKLSNGSLELLGLEENKVPAIMSHPPEKKKKKHEITLSLHQEKYVEIM